MCRISLNQILRSKSQENHFKKTGLPIYYEKKKLNKSNKIKYEISMKHFKVKLNLAKWLIRESLMIFVVRL